MMEDIERQLQKQVQKTVVHYNMLENAENVLLAVSGGADSTALLHTMFSLKSALKINLFAVHLNHNLRGNESLRDEKFVRDMCQKMQIPLTVYSEDIATGAKNASLGTEEYARIRRYDLFCSLALSQNARLATAHNLNDLAETLIFNVTRGSGLNGLCSIKPKRDNIIRPLINTTREDIEKYLAAKKLDYVTDSTNLSDDYTRNKIRHNILPQLCEINPSFLQSALRLVNNAEMAEKFISDSANKLIKQNADKMLLKKQSDAVICEYIRKRCIKELDITPEYSQTLTAADIIKKGYGKVQLHGNNFMYIDAGNVFFGQPHTEPDEPFCIEISADEVTTPYEKYVFTQISREEYDKQRKINNLLLKNAVDCDKMGNSLVIRSRLSGDFIRLCGRNCTKTLKKLMNEQKIPEKIRNRLGVLSNDKNDVLWVENYGVAEFAAVDENTRRVLVITPIDKE